MHVLHQQNFENNNTMVILETIAVGAVIYSIHKNRKYKQMKRQAQKNGKTIVITNTVYKKSSQLTSPGASAGTQTEPESSKITSNIPPIPGHLKSTAIPPPMSNFEEVHVNHTQPSNVNVRLSSVIIRDDFGRPVVIGPKGSLTLVNGNVQALTTTPTKEVLQEGKHYTIDAITAEGQRYDNMSFYYYGIFEGDLFFSAVSPMQAQHLINL